MADADVVISLATMPGVEKAAFMCGYEAGYLDRMANEERTYEQALADLAAHYVRMIHLNEEVERTLASTLATGPFADLADLRGQHERAERQRQILRDRGIV